MDATVVILDWDSMSFVVVVVVVLWVHCWLDVRRLLLWSVVVQELWQPLSVDMIVSPWSEMDEKIFVKYLKFPSIAVIRCLAICFSSVFFSQSEQSAGIL